LITFGGYHYKVFDTIGLEEPGLNPPQYLDAIVNAYNLIKKLNSEGGIDLLLFCVKAGRVTATFQSNYRLFYEWLCEEKVPVVLVLTSKESKIVWRIGGPETSTSLHNTRSVLLVMLALPQSTIWMGGSSNCTKNRVVWFVTLSRHILKARVHGVGARDCL
jgi:hypothetical protein